MSVGRHWLQLKHRTPVPESLVQSLCVLAWHHRWYSWVGATLLAFYGAGRLGEVLRCSREDLVLPEDVLEPQGSAVFLRLRSFKSRMRQPAKIQHMKVTDGLACRLLSKIFRALDFDQPLFGSAAYQYRKRWDYLLLKLGIPKDISITPGGPSWWCCSFSLQAWKADSRSPLAPAFEEPDNA